MAEHRRAWRTVRDSSGDFFDPAGAMISDRERRAYRRTRVLWGALLRCAEGDARLPVTVANISAGGAKLVFSETPDEAEAEVVDRLDPGLDVVLILPEIGDFSASVVWIARGCLGVQFDLPPEEIAAAIGAVVLDTRVP
jgi:hypothetical protein